MIRIDSLWLAARPVDMRAGADRLLASVVQVFGSAQAIRTKLSARHVPNDVVAVPEVPRTISGKKLEVPIKRILLGQPVERSVNKDSMANPGVIDWFVAFARARGAQPA